MFGFEITFDLLIVAIFAQTIALSLIILTIYFKIKKIQYKNIVLNEKIEEKLDRVESKLSYLFNQVSVITANQEKYNYPKSSLNPSAYYPTKVPTKEESDSPSMLKNITLNGQNSNSKIVDTRLTAAKSEELDLIPEPIPSPKTPYFSEPKSESAITNTTPSLPSNHHLFSELSTSNKPSDAAVKDSPVDSVRNNKEFTNTKNFADNDSAVEKNTNPEIDKIEKEILTALKRLGGGDGNGNSYWDREVDGYGDDDSSRREDIIYPTAKKSDRKVKNID
ncbi:MAG: hypothetical protein L0H53_02765 [Candidatus Nitrosocosmicus sp.]|nr:hypothetical protein [Candidatus Nitrosocosmicus sp.]MDN5866692.1 hypothetical protein [Candidatus Nitrosocosmicus sp.]